MRRVGVAAALATVLLAGCVPGGGAAPAGPPTTTVTVTPRAAPTPSTASSAAPTTATATATSTALAVTPSDGRPLAARLTIPALKVNRLVVQPYQGFTDDAAGTVIQNGGLAASPYGPQGGTGPGGIGNYQVTAHRTTAPAPFAQLPTVGVGAVIYVDAGGVRYTYRITATRQTSFRSAASLAEQRAAVPGQPGVAPTQAMITLSTCATPEDNAARNYWRDAQHNPEHRIDKIGVLVATGPAPA